MRSMIEPILETHGYLEVSALLNCYKNPEKTIQGRKILDLFRGQGHRVSLELRCSSPNLQTIISELDVVLLLRKLVASSALAASQENIFKTIGINIITVDLVEVLLIAT